MEAYKRLLTGVITTNDSFEIPFFQRTYVWDEEQWQRLIDDVIYATMYKKPLFLGAIILKERKDENDVTDAYVVIDGQQRLTTLFIFFKVLNLVTSGGSIFKSTFIKTNGEPVLKQSHNAFDDFNEIMLLNTIEDIPVSEKSSNIKKAYKFFLDILNDIFVVKRNKDSNGKTIIDYKNIHKFLNFVVITLQDGEDEQQIFDTINSLGVKLTTGELLKNYLFADDTLEDYNIIWKPVFENSKETEEFWSHQITTGRLNKRTIDVFLYYFLQIKVQESGIVGDKKLYRRWENLFSSFKKLVEANHIDKDVLAREISQYARIFMECFRQEEDSEEIPSEFGIDRIRFIINNLDTTTLIPYVLYIVNCVNDLEERNKIFKYIETYIIRRIITNDNNNNYSDLFTENLIGQHIKSYASLVKYISSKEPMQSLSMPSNEKVKRGFNQTEFKNNKRALGILYLLESVARSENHSTRLRAFSGYTLEHIMPKSWKQHWPLPSNGSDIDRDAKILTLGNLTMLTNKLNIKLRNFDWKTKLSGKDGYEGLKALSSGITTLANYLELSDWDESVIESRANYLAGLANQIWNI